MEQVNLKPGDIVSVKEHKDPIHVIVGAKEGLVYTMPIRINDDGSTSILSRPGSVSLDMIHFIEPEEDEDEEDQLSLSLQDILTGYEQFIKEKGGELSQEEKNTLTEDFTYFDPITINRNRN